MPAQPLIIASFGGGIVAEGSADTQRTDELQRADDYDIGPRGALIAASDLTGLYNIASSSLGTGVFLRIYGMGVIAAPNAPRLMFVGDDNIGQVQLSFGQVDGPQLGGTTPATSVPQGWIITSAVFPYVNLAGKQLRVMLVALGSRAPFDARNGSGLQVVTFDPSTGGFSRLPIFEYDSLGTGPLGELFQVTSVPGTNSQQLFPRGVVAYNNHAFIWGFDNADFTHGEGPNKLMFSNVGNPLKFGNDPTPYPENPETDRAFTDSDSFVIGGAGDQIRAGYVWRGKLWIGTNQGLHYVEGFGRESFQTNGAIAVVTTNVIGPYAMIEGADKLLHGVSDLGHWVFNGQVLTPVGDKLRDKDQHSLGFWDLIWTDSSRTLADYPGQTNQDLVWMLADDTMKAVWIVIPFCSAAAGFGFGTDTVAIKYNCVTGGYTRQTFANQILTAGTVFKRDATNAERIIVCTPGSADNVSRYRYKATQEASPVMPATLPVVTVGEYAPHGPDGVGVDRKLYMTLSWVPGALPLVFSITPYVDQKPVPPTAVKLSIQPAVPIAPNDGDVWVDTSGTDTNLGNGTAGAFTPASPADYLVKRWSADRAKWDFVPVGGNQGTRMTIPIAYTSTRGTRVKFDINCLSAAGRYQLEGLSLDPETIRGDE